MGQFFLDMFWFSNGDMEYTLIPLYVGIIFSWVMVVLSKSTGDFDKDPQPVDSLQPDTNAVVVGTVSVSEPHLWNDTEYAYFRNAKTGEQHPIDGLLLLDDDTGQVSIRLMDAQVDIPTIDTEEDIVGIQQHEKVFVRGYLNSDREFSSTYYTSEKHKGEVEDPVEVQFESFENKVREVQKMLGGCFLFLILPVCFIFPTVQYHKLWDMEITHVVTDKYEDDESYYLYFEEWPTRLIVSEDLYNACDIDAMVHKASKTLDFGCTDYPSSQFRRNQSISSQLWHNVGDLFLLFFLGFLTTLTREKKTTTRPE